MLFFQDLLDLKQTEGIKSSLKVTMFGFDPEWNDGCLLKRPVCKLMPLTHLFRFPSVTTDNGRVVK